MNPLQVGQFEPVIDIISLHGRKSPVRPSLGQETSCTGCYPGVNFRVRRAFSLLAINSLRKSPETVLAVARKPQRLPDYFTHEETSALVAAAPNYKARMAMRVMLRTGLRIRLCLSLRPRTSGSTGTRPSSA